MSEWFSVLAVFALLWAVDGFRILPRRGFTVVGGRAGVRNGRSKRGWRRCEARARVRYSRLSIPGWLPTSWRILAPDVPFAFSPVGICNVTVGAAGRPAETPREIRAWRWEDIREVGVARGWLFINGESFCADMGHLKGPELLALAQSSPEVRRQKIERLLRGWFRPAHVRRRVGVLTARTALPAALNVITLVGLVALSAYVVGDVASRLSPARSESIAAVLPWLVIGLFIFHFAAVVLAVRAKRRLRAVAPEKRSANLFSALLLPPQALRLRSLLSDGYFPPQHPLAVILAFGNRESRTAHAFNAVADLRWPLEPATLDPVAREIIGWYRERLDHEFGLRLTEAGLAAKELLEPPEPDSPASRSYCPRCRAQFVGDGVCPNGVALRPLNSSRN